MNLCAIRRRPHASDSAGLQEPGGVPGGGFEALAARNDTRHIGAPTLPGYIDTHRTGYVADRIRTRERAVAIATILAGVVGVAVVAKGADLRA